MRYKFVFIMTTFHNVIEITNIFGNGNMSVKEAYL